MLEFLKKKVKANPSGYTGAGDTTKSVIHSFVILSMQYKICVKCNSCHYAIQII